MNCCHLRAFLVCACRAKQQTLHPRGALAANKWAPRSQVSSNPSFLFLSAKSKVRASPRCALQKLDSQLCPNHACGAVWCMLCHACLSRRYHKGHRAAPSTQARARRHRNNTKIQYAGVERFPLEAPEICQADPPPSLAHIAMTIQLAACRTRHSKRRDRPGR